MTPTFQFLLTIVSVLCVFPCHTSAKETGLSDKSIVYTGDPTHIALVGRGYFYAMDKNENPVVLQSGKLSVDSINRVGLLVNGEFYFFDPVVTVPTDHTLLIIDSDGTVRTRSPGSDSLSAAGKIDCIKICEPDIVKKRKGVCYLRFDSPIRKDINDLRGQDAIIISGWIGDWVREAKSNRASGKTSK
jgi:flagellar basal body rod protein FlgF